MEAWKFTLSYQLLKFPSLRFGQTFTVDTSPFFHRSQREGEEYGKLRIWHAQSLEMGFVFVGNPTILSD
jgi:hypothetical protein